MDRIWNYQSKKYVYNTATMFLMLVILGSISMILMVLPVLYITIIVWWIPYKFIYNDFDGCINSGIIRRDFLSSTMRTILLLSALSGVIVGITLVLFKGTAYIFKVEGMLYKEIIGDIFGETNFLTVILYNFISMAQSLTLNTIYMELCYKYGRIAFVIIVGLTIFSVLGNMFGYEIIRVFNMIKDFLLYDDNILIQTVKSAVYFTILYQILKSQVLKLELN